GCTLDGASLYAHSLGLNAPPARSTTSARRPRGTRAASGPAARLHGTAIRKRTSARRAATARSDRPCGRWLRPARAVVLRSAYRLARCAPSHSIVAGGLLETS